MSENEVVLNCDNQSAVCLASNPVYHARSKHIDVRYHKVREMVESKELVLEKIHTLTADVLTKILPKERHSTCVKLQNVEG